MDVREMLERLCRAPGPSGFEQAAADEAAALLEPFVDEITGDRRGNVIGVRRCGRKGAKRVLLDAHLDEIGFVITGISQGFLRFQTVGGVDPRMLPSSEVTVLTDPPLHGVVACLPPHVLTKAEMDKAFSMDKLYIDVGLSQEAAEERIPIGTRAVFSGQVLSLGERQLSGKAMDDRACFACLIKVAELLMDKPLDVDVYFMGSVGEEVGGSGAACGAFAIDPEVCIAVDVTHGRTPDGPKDKTFPLGGGAAIGVGPNMTRWIGTRMLALARELQIPHQIEVMEGSSGTNGWDMQIAREGIPTMVISLPLKYMHTPVETLELTDMEAVAGLIAAFVLAMGKEDMP